MARFLFLFLSALTFLGPHQRVAGQQSSAAPLRFGISPVKRTFSKGEDVVLVFVICNNSEDPAFVSRKPYDEFVDLDIKGPEGEEINRRAKPYIDSKSYHREDFIVLKKGECARSRASISLKNGLGFEIKKSGPYSLAGEYSMGPPEYFAPLAGTVEVPKGTFKAKTATFCVATCTAHKTQ